MQPTAMQAPSTVRVQPASPMEIPSGKTAKAGKSGFKELLETALLETETKPQATDTGLPGTADQAPASTDQPGDTGTDTEEADANTAAALTGQPAAQTPVAHTVVLPTEGTEIAAVIETAEPLPIQTGTVLPPVTTAPPSEQAPLVTPALPQAQAPAAPEAPAQAVPEIAGQATRPDAAQAPQTPQTQQDAQTEIPAGDILSVETTVQPEQPVPAETQPGPTAQIPADAAQDKLGAMLNQARQELEGIKPQAEAEPTAEPLEAEIKPAATEHAPPAEEKAAPEKPHPSMPRTVQQTKPDPATVEQRPMLKEQTQETRKTTDTQDTKAVTPEPQPEPVRNEAPQAVRQTQEPRPAAKAPDQLEQIRVEMDRSLEQNRMEFRMQLQPEELGKVDVKMVLEGGRLAVEILAASPKAAEALSRQAAGLVQSLKLHDFEVDSIQVVNESQSADSHMDGAFNMMNGQTQQGDDQAAAGKPGHSRGGHGGSGGETGEIDVVEERPAERYRSPDRLMDYAV